MTSLLQVIKNSEVIVCVGSGGVGKTTTAAAIAMAAAKNGRKTLVLTIDPSKRLATTLGIDSKTSEDTLVFESENGGSLSATLVQSQEVFDQFVDTFIKSPERAAKLKANTLYRHLSTTLSGSQEFTAIEKLYSSWIKEKYDLIVLDTPPGQHTLDFLRAPQKFHALFQENITQWFRASPKKGFLGKILQTGTNQAFHVLDKLTGKVFLQELRDFYSNIQSLEAHLREHTMQTHKLLSQQSSAFVLITSLDQVRMEEAQYIGREIEKDGFFLNAVVINKAMPLWLLHGDSLKTDSLPTHLREKALEFYKKQEHYSTVKQEEFKKFQSELFSRFTIHKIPDYGQDIYDLKSLEMLCDSF